MHLYVSLIFLFGSLAYADNYNEANVGTYDSGYETAEKYQPPPKKPISAGGDNQLGYVDSGDENPFDKIFNYWNNVVKSGKYVKNPQNEKYANLLPTIKKDWNDQIQKAPQGVQGDWVSTLTTALPAITNAASAFINIFSQLADLWSKWQSALKSTGALFDSPEDIPDWQKELNDYNAARQQAGRSPVGGLAQLLGQFPPKPEQLIRSGGEQLVDLAANQLGRA